MPTARADTAAVTGMDGKIHVLNGRLGDGVQALRVHEIYDPFNKSWATGPAPAGGHYGGRAVVGRDGLIYYMGGYYRDSSLDVFDSVAKLWRSRAPMLTGRYGFAAVTLLDGRLLTIGGDTGGGAENVAVLEAFNPATNSWSKLAPLPVPRAFMGAAVGQDGKVYVIGGASLGVKLATVHVYDPATNSWSTAAPLPTPRSSLAVIAGADGRIYAIGGENGSVLNIVEAYDPTLNAWQRMSAMPTPRFLVSAARSVDGRIFVFGGINSAGLFGITVNEAFTTFTCGCSSTVPGLLGLAEPSTGGFAKPGRVAGSAGTRAQSAEPDRKSPLVLPAHEYAQARSGAATCDSFSPVRDVAPEP